MHSLIGNWRNHPSSSCSCDFRMSNFTRSHGGTFHGPHTHLYWRISAQITHQKGNFWCLFNSFCDHGSYVCLQFGNHFNNIRAWVAYQVENTLRSELRISFNNNNMHYLWNYSRKPEFADSARQIIRSEGCDRFIPQKKIRWWSVSIKSKISRKNQILISVKTGEVIKWIEKIFSFWNTNDATTHRYQRICLSNGVCRNRLQCRFRSVCSCHHGYCAIHCSYLLNELPSKDQKTSHDSLRKSGNGIVLLGNRYSLWVCKWVSRRILDRCATHFYLHDDSRRYFDSSSLGLCAWSITWKSPSILIDYELVHVFSDNRSIPSDKFELWIRTNVFSIWHNFFGTIFAKLLRNGWVKAQRQRSSYCWA